MTSRQTELTNRLTELKSNRAKELKQKQPSKVYLDDLKLSIDSCEKQLEFLKTNPASFPIINGS